MHCTQWHWSPGQPSPRPDADLVLAFGPRSLLADPAAFEALRQQVPDAPIVGCSTGGEIAGETVSDGSIALSALRFERTRVRVEHQAAPAGVDSETVGRLLAARLPEYADDEPLCHVLTFADGLALNGTRFVRGMESVLPAGVAVTGGLAADDDRFERTPVWADGVVPEAGAVAVGLYGRHLRVGTGAIGGWRPFGPDRVVTRAEGNVLFELDGRSALPLYKQYLGAHADALPASGLLFPLGLRDENGGADLVRTILAVDDDAGSITFAGDVPEGATSRLMMTNPEAIIGGASDAAQAALSTLGTAPEFALLVSCVGRRWVLHQRTEEEVEEAGTVLGHPALAGFYSYGELAPSADGVCGALHNQTMTITAMAEV